MKDENSSFVRWLNNVRQRRQSEISATETAETVKKPSPEVIKRVTGPVISSVERPAGNYYHFDFLIEINVGGTIHLGRPCYPYQTSGTPPATFWAIDAKYLLPEPSISRARWVDDPQKGLSGRTITSPEDFLGAEGIIGGVNCFFEHILNTGENPVMPPDWSSSLSSEATITDKMRLLEQIWKANKNVVVFSIYCNKNQSRLAYGFPRDLFRNTAVNTQ
jgi:hypothetical protein